MKLRRMLLIATIALAAGLVAVFEGVIELIALAVLAALSAIYGVVRAFEEMEK